MTRAQLSEVDHFEVWNEFGKIEWLGRCDLLGLNL
jgi:hypothetical protein